MLTKCGNFPQNNSKRPPVKVRSVEEDANQMTASSYYTNLIQFDYLSCMVNFYHCLFITTNLHICFLSEHPLCDCFNGHPSQRESPSRGLHIQFSFTSQAKVRYFQLLVLSEQDIPTSKITVHQAKACQVLLNVKRTCKMLINVPPSPTAYGTYVHAYAPLTEDWAD